LSKLSAKFFNSIPFQPIGYKFVVDLIVKSMGRFKVVEYPIVFEKLKMGSSKTGKEGIETLAVIWMLWFWKTNYNSHKTHLFFKSFDKLLTR
jgi:hypothetical protein